MIEILVIGLFSSLIALVVLFFWFLSELKDSKKIELEGYKWGISILGHQQSTNRLRYLLENIPENIDFDTGAWRAVHEFEESFKRE